MGFAKTTVGAESQPQVVDLHNVSGAAVAIDSVGFGGADAADFKFAAGGCGWLEADQHCTAWVSFAPGSTGAKTATLSVKLKEAPEQTVQLSGEAVAPQLSFSPGSHDFGIQRVNRGEGSTNFQLTNVGEAATQLNGVGIGGQDPNNFWTNGDCWGGRWLQPGESCNVGVGFNPWDVVPYAAELQVGSSGTIFTAALSGHGGRAIVETGESRTEFGAAAAGTYGDVREIVFTNHGNMETAFFIAVIASGSVGSFQLLEEDCTGVPLLPEESCTVEIRFEPQSAGPKLARLALFGNDDGGAMAELSGEGVAAELPGAAAGAGSGATGPAAGTAGTATGAAKAVGRRGKNRRFGRNTTLTPGRALCLGLCQRGTALRKRTVVGG